jgi:hypothetical protein
MKKYLFTILLAVGFSQLFSQNKDSVQTEEVLDVEYLQAEETTLVDSIGSFFQYRVEFIQNCSYIKEDVTANIRDLFKSDVSFNQTLNQFIFTTKKDMTQYELSENLSMVVTYFKKIDLMRLSSLNKSSN